MSERWQVIHGDALETLRAMERWSIDAIVTDPPYAITNDAAIATSRTVRLPAETQFFASWLREHVAEWLRVVRPAGAIWLTLDWRGCVVLDDVAARLGVRRAPKVAVWDKEYIGMGGVLRCSYETFAVLMMNEFEPRTRSERDVWRHPWGGGGQPGEHPAEKPVALMCRAVELVSCEDSLILDPFAGSGTTGVACIASRRRFVGVERDSDYAEVARRRIADAEAQGNLFAESGPALRALGEPDDG